MRLPGGQSQNVQADFPEKVKAVQLSGAGKGMVEGDFGLIRGTTAVGWELTLNTGAGCGGTPAAAHPSVGIFGSGGAPWHSAKVTGGLAAAVSCWGRWRCRESFRASQRGSIFSWGSTSSTSESRHRVEAGRGMCWGQGRGDSRSRLCWCSAGHPGRTVGSRVGTLVLALAQG